MDDAKQQVVDKLKTATNVLVTVTANPSVDQLAACIGLTLLLNKLDKHATAVFSGKIPSTIKFLKPEETLEKTTDSLRDFIISLDKTKADKLRYKVEDTVVKIFITPYRSTITEKDLVFSQGDFNVDVVLALGVHRQEDLDKAIESHGRILHDAVVIGVNNTPHTELGTINWLDENASSLSEMISGLQTELGADLLDEQIATALLTGVVAETNHFSNGKTTPATMSVSANLLAAGANQQLVARELKDEHPANISQSSSSPSQPKKSEDGSLQITHPDQAEHKPKSENNEPRALPSKPDEKKPDTKPDTISHAKAYGPELDKHDPKPMGDPRMITHPPTFDPPAKAVEGADVFDPSIDMADKADAKPPLLRRNDEPAPSIDSVLGAPKTTDLPPLDSDQTLSELEQTVHAVHNGHPPEDEVDSARLAVESALQASGGPLDPPAAFNAQPFDIDLGHDAVDVDTPPPPPAFSPEFGTEAAAPVTNDALPELSSTPDSPAPFEPPITQPQPPMPAWMTPAASTPTVPVNLPEPPAFNPAANEPAPLRMSPADQPFTMPLPPSNSMTPGQTDLPPVQNTEPQGPPPPPVPPPMMPPSFGTR